MSTNKERTLARDVIATQIPSGDKHPLAAGEQALTLRPKDIHIHTSMSRIWMERGDKTKAEHHGAQARILGWGDQLKEPEGKQPGEL